MPLENEKAPVKLSLPLVIPLKRKKHPLLVENKLNGHTGIPARSLLRAQIRR